MKVDAAEGANENANGALHAASVKIQTTVIWRYPLQAMEMTRRREAAGFGTELLNHRSAWPHANPCLPGSFWRAVICENNSAGTNSSPKLKKLTPEQLKPVLVQHASRGDQGAKDLLQLLLPETPKDRERAQTGFVSTAPCNVRLWMRNRKSGSSG